MTYTPTRATSTYPAPSQRSRGRRRGEVLRGVASVLLLAGLVVGIPAALLLVAPLTIPTSWPTLEQIGAALTRPDDGTLFLGALTIIAWAAWAAFTLCVLLETIAQARGLPTPHLPGLRTSQRAAAVLVASIGLLIAPTGAALIPLAYAQPAPASAAPMTGPSSRPIGAFAPAPVSPAVERNATSAPPAAASRPAESSRQPTVTVQRGDSLWRLAERHLGNGERFTEIVALNTGRPQPDGRALTDAHWIHPGWILRLPGDATALPQPGATKAAAQGGEEKAVHRVAPGDTLWDIAHDDLGDGTRYPEIYDLNAGVTQPDGRTLTDPDLIHPGWRLQLPPAPQPEAPAPSTAPTEESPAPIPPPEADGDAEGNPPEEATADAAVGREATALDADAVAASGVNDEAPAGTLGQAFFLGLTALASAGFIGEIARRRRRQQRLRHTGERIPLPASGTAAADAERALRRAPQPLKVENLKRALHALAPACAAAGQDLPRIGAVRVGDHAVELLLTEDDAAPVPPFTASGPRTWTATHHHLTDETEPDDLDDYPEPYPALVTIGGDHDAVILVNLEAAGTLSIDATDPEAARATLRAIACELATSALSDRAALLVGPDLADLAEATDSVLLAAATTDATLAARLKTDTGEAARQLSGGDAGDALHARSGRLAEGTWNPTVYLGEHIDAAVAQWAGLAVITAQTANRGWRLTLGQDGNARLDPLGIDLTAARLVPDAYESLLELLRTAEAQPKRQASRDASTVQVEAVEALASLPRPVGPASPVPDAAAAPLAAATPGPRVLLIGPVQVTGTARASRDDRSRRNTEIVAYLALHPGASAAEVDEVIGHGAIVSTAVRNTTISRVRGWLGKDPDDEPYLPAFSAEEGYRLAPTVSTDWHEFLALARRGLAAGPAGTEDLTAALSLVRGRPMSGVRPGTYDWAEAITQEMISTITDAAHVLATIQLEAGEPAAAAEAAAIGLTVDACNEQLYRDAITAARRRGDGDEVQRLAGNLRAQIEKIDPDGDLDDETLECLEQRVASFGGLRTSTSSD